MLFRSVVFAGIGSKPPPAAARAITEAVSGPLQRSELRLFLEALTYTSEGLLSASRIASSIGLHSSAAIATAKLAQPEVEMAGVLAALPHITDVSLATIATPYRYILNISVAPETSQASQTAVQSTCYSVGVMMKSGGLALLQFDQKQFAVFKDLHDKLHVKMLEKHKGTASQATVARMGTVLGVPRYQELVRQLTTGAAPLACMAADVGAAWHGEACTAADIVVPQKDLHTAIEQIARFLNASPGGGGDL